MIGSKIKGLGEVVLRVSNINRVKEFYEEVIGLEILAQDTHFVFFKIAEGIRGHPQILALFDTTIPPEFGQLRNNPVIKSSNLHHFALEIDRLDYDAILHSLTNKGIQAKTRVFNWTQWKSIYLQDPELNVVELVCFDPSLEKE